MNLYILIFIISVFIASLSQVILKMSANKTHTKLVDEYRNKYVIVAYIMFLSSTLLTMVAYKKVPLSLGPLIESMGFIFVAVMSFVILKEHFSMRKKIGYLTILIGIVIVVW